MYCEGCGKELAKDANFCGRCQRPVVREDDSELDIVYTPTGDGYQPQYAKRGQAVSRGRSDIVPFRPGGYKYSDFVDSGDEERGTRTVRGVYLPDRQPVVEVPPGTKRAAGVKARAVVDQWATAAIAISWLPGSTFGLGTADMAMIRNVATCFAVANFDTEAAVGTVTASLTGRYAAEVLTFAGPLG